MTWFLISIAGYFANAVSTLGDKILLNKLISHPAVYAFLVSLFSLSALLFAPFGFYYPGVATLVVGLVAGILFTAALLLFFTALQKGEASRVDPLVGGISPIFVLIFAWLILQETLTPVQIAAFFVILVGGFLIAHKRSARGAGLDRKAIMIGIGAAALFALSHVLSKWTYVHSSFISGLVWRSIGCFLGSMIILAIPYYRKEIMDSMKRSRTTTGIVFILSNFFAAVSFVLINYAFSIGPIALVNALAGTQYIFLFFLILPLSKKYQNLLEETVTPKVIWQKVLSLAFIAVGIFMLFA